jgi:CheY-like chemotaxis protein/curved DNA-binding protein CbpA
LAEILVVDHSAKKRTWLNKILNVGGHQVFFCKDGAEAVGAFQQTRPDAVILTLNLPKLPGPKLAQQIKEMPEGKRTPVILTGSGPIFHRAVMDAKFDPGWNVDSILEEPYSGSLILSTLAEQIAHFAGPADATEDTAESVGDDKAHDASWDAPRPSPSPECMDDFAEQVEMERLSLEIKNLQKRKTESEAKYSHAESEARDRLTMLQVDADMLEGEINSLLEDKGKKEEEYRQREEEAKSRLAELQAGITSAQKELESLENSKDDLGQERAQAQEKAHSAVERAQSEANILAEEISELRAKRDEAAHRREMEEEQSKSRITELRSESKNLEEEVACIGDRKAKEQEAFDQVKSEFDEKIESRHGEIEALNGEIRKLHESKETVAREKESGEREHQEALSGMRDEKLKLEDAIGVLQAAKIEAENTQRHSLAQSQERMAEIQAESDKLRAEMTALHQKRDEFLAQQETEEVQAASKITELGKEASGLEEKIITLHEQSDQTQQTLLNRKAETEKEISSSKLEVEQLNSAIGELREKKEKTENETIAGDQKRQKILSALHEDKRKLEDQLALLKKSKIETEQTQAELLEQSRHRIEKANAESDKLRAEADHLRNEKDQLLQRLKQEEEEATSKIDALRLEAQGLGSEVASNRAAREKEESDAEKRKMELEEVISTLKSEHRQLNAKIGELRELEESDGRGKSSLVQEHEKTLASYRDKKKIADDELSSLTARIEEQKANQARSLSEAQNEIVAVQAKSETLRSEADRLRKANADMDRELRKKKEGAEERIITLQSEADHLCDQIVAQKAQHAKESGDAAQSVHDRLHSLREKTEQIEKYAGLVRRKRQVEESKAEKASRQLAVVKDELKKVGVFIQDAKSERRQYQGDIKSSKAEYDRISRNLDTTRKQLDDAKKEMENFKASEFESQSARKVEMEALEARKNGVESDLNTKEIEARERLAEMQLQLHDIIDNNRNQRLEMDAERRRHEEDIQHCGQQAKIKLAKIHAKALDAREAVIKSHRIYKAQKESLKCAQERLRARLIEAELNQREKVAKDQLMRIHAEMLEINGAIKNIRSKREHVAQGHSRFDDGDFLNKEIKSVEKTIENVMRISSRQDLDSFVESTARSKPVAGAAIAPVKEKVARPESTRESKTEAHQKLEKNAGLISKPKIEKAAPKTEDEKRQRIEDIFSELVPGGGSRSQMPKLDVKKVYQDAPEPEDAMTVSDELSDIMESAAKSVDRNAAEDVLSSKLMGAYQQPKEDDPPSPHDAIPGFQTTAEVGAEDELVNEIVHKHSVLKSANYFELLGIPQTATEQEIRYAYRWMTRKFYPEKIQGGYSQEIQIKAKEVMDRATEAYRVLVEFKTRRDYIKNMGHPVEKQKRSVYTVLQAENEFNIGLSAVKHRAWHIARQHFAKAMEMFPEEALYHAYFGWAIYNMQDIKLAERTAQAQVLLEKAIGLNPKVDQAYFFLGMIMKDKDLLDKASKLFAQAYRINKKNKEAQNQLKILMKMKQGQNAEAESVGPTAEAESESFLSGDFNVGRVKDAIKKVFSS